MEYSAIFGFCEKINCVTSLCVGVNLSPVFMCVCVCVCRSSWYMLCKSNYTDDGSINTRECFESRNCDKPNREIDWSYAVMLKIKPTKLDASKCEWKEGKDDKSIWYVCAIECVGCIYFICSIHRDTQKALTFSFRKGGLALSLFFFVPFFLSFGLFFWHDKTVCVHEQVLERVCVWRC